MPQPLTPFLGTPLWLSLAVSPGVQLRLGATYPAQKELDGAAREVDCVCVLGEQKVGRTLSSRPLFSRGTSGQPIRAPAGHAQSHAPWSRTGRWQGRALRPGLHPALQLCPPPLSSWFLHFQMKTLISQEPVGPGVGGGDSTKEPLPGTLRSISQQQESWAVAGHLVCGQETATAQPHGASHLQSHKGRGRGTTSLRSAWTKE